MTQVAIRSRAPQGTRLHGIILCWYEAWLRYRRERDRSVPDVVRREFERFLRCGDPSFGYALLGCRRCGTARGFARSCKGRAWCPHCLARRQAKLAPRLVHSVFGMLPVRHWVLCLPPQLRYTLGYDPVMLTAVLSAFVESIFRYLRRKAKREFDLKTVELAYPGAVSVIHRCSADLDTNLHFHVLVPDGAFIRLTTDGPVTFRPVTPPTDEEIQAVAFGACRLTCRALERGKHWRPLRSGSSSDTVAGKLTFGDRKGERAKFFGEAARYGKGGVASRSGAYAFHVNADHAVDAGDQQGLTELAEYVLAPPIADGQVALRESGSVALDLRRTRHDGSGEAVWTPMEFLDRLAALVGRTRAKSLRYHGVYAPNAALREAVMPWRVLEQPAPDGEETDESEAYGAYHAMHHAEDEPACPLCCRRLTLIEVVTPRHTYRNPGWKPPDGGTNPRVQDSMGSNFGLRDAEVRGEICRL